MRKRKLRIASIEKNFAINQAYYAGWRDGVKKAEKWLRW